MKVLIDIEDNKAASLIAKLQALSYVKTQTLTEESADLLSEIKQAVEELNKVQRGDLKARNVEELLNEL
ncbi:MAG: hypothetical protein RIF33_26665 [Cyclobacteriaceae bacterium]